LRFSLHGGKECGIYSARIRVEIRKYFVLLVGRPGLDPGTLGAISDRTGPSLSVQISWSNEVGRSPQFADVSQSLVSWLGVWLDKSSYTGLANARFETSDGEEIQFRIGVD